MTAESFRGSLSEPILDQLTTAMGIENRMGAAEAARGGAAPRVTWVPPPKAARRYSKVAQQRPDLHVKHVHDVAIAFQVHLWAESYAAAEDLERRLETALYALFSENAYELGPEGEQVGETSPTGQGSIGWLFIVPVRLLRVPIPVTQHRTVKLGSASGQGVVTDPKGAAPTNGQTPTVTYP